MPSPPALIAASTAGALGIALLVVALVDEPLDRPRRRLPLLVCGAGGCLAGAVTVVLAAHGHALAAIASAGLAACAAAVVVALVRARPRDDDDGGGGGGRGAPGPPPGPDGLGIDWPAFEKAFWEHVDERMAGPVAP